MKKRIISTLLATLMLVISTFFAGRTTTELKENPQQIVVKDKTNNKKGLGQLLLSFIGSTVIGAAVIDSIGAGIYFCDKNDELQPVKKLLPEGIEVFRKNSNGSSSLLAIIQFGKIIQLSSNEKYYLKFKNSETITQQFEIDEKNPEYTIDYSAEILVQMYPDQFIIPPIDPKFEVSNGIIGVNKFTFKKILGCLTDSNSARNLAGISREISNPQNSWLLSYRDIEHFPENMPPIKIWRDTFDRYQSGSENKPTCIEFHSNLLQFMVLPDVLKEAKENEEKSTRMTEINLFEPNVEAKRKYYDVAFHLLNKYRELGLSWGANSENRKIFFNPFTLKFLKELEKVITRYQCNSVGIMTNNSYNFMRYTIKEEGVADIIRLCKKYGVKVVD